MSSSNAGYLVFWLIHNNTLNLRYLEFGIIYDVSCTYATEMTRNQWSNTNKVIPRAICTRTKQCQTSTRMLIHIYTAKQRGCFKWRECYLLPTWARKISCRRFGYPGCRQAEETVVVYYRSCWFWIRQQPRSCS